MSQSDKESLFPRQDGPAPNGSKGREVPLLLIMAESPGVSALLEEILKEFHPVTVLSGEEGLSLFRYNRPDLVLLSTGLRDADPFDLCRTITEDSPSEPIPLIFVSSKNDSREKTRGLESGAADFICEPFDPDELSARVKAQLKIHSLTGNLSRTNRDLSTALAELGKQNERLHRELEAAAEVQRALLPENGNDIAGLKLEWRLTPSASVAGDLLDWFVLDRNRIGFYLVDVSGHGAASGLLAASIHQALIPRPDRSCLVRARSGENNGWIPVRPEEVGRELEGLFPYGRFEKYFTMFYGILNHWTGQLHYLTAGHPRPIVLPRKGKLRELETTGPPIGLEAGSFTTAETILEPGDRLFVYSDGITESEGVEGFYGPKRLIKILTKGRGEELSLSLNLVLEDLINFSGEKPPLDDVTCLGLELSGKQARLF